MHLHLQHTIATAVEPSPNVLRVAAMFGLGIDQARTIPIIPPTDLHLVGGQLIFITGPSGSGKSSLLRLIADAIAAATPPRAKLIRFDALPDLADRPLVDCFDGLPLETVLSLFARAGLGDAFVMLRRPRELSDGQRYRLRLAQTMAIAQQAAHDDDNNGGSDGDALTVVLADEFGATLDRITAAVIARNVRKWTRDQPHLCFIAATTHDDLLEPLAPDIVIEKPLGAALVIAQRAD